MKLEEYEKIVKKNSKKEDKFTNIIKSFFIGGLMGVLGQVFVFLLEKYF